MNRLVPRLPSADYSGLRRRMPGLNLSLYESLRLSDEPVVIAVDSTGVREFTRLEAELTGNMGRSVTLRSTWP